MNGREWLSRQLNAAGIGFESNRNKFISIDDFEQAQKLLNQQLDIDWCLTLNNLATGHKPGRSFPGSAL
ncbi:hypothetical protein MHK_006816, partial [Candidatus Magnetomorum sp. HK-1]